VKIYLTSSVPIHSYSFTLEGFSNILSATTSDIIAGSALNFGSDNIHIFGDYFYGGSLMEDVSELIDPADGGLFLSVLADYNYDENYNYDGYFLTFDEVLPGMNGQGTNFFTYDEEEEAIYPVTHEWIRTTWEMGENGVHNFIGEDCNGYIGGISEWDDCGACTLVDTEEDFNYAQDCTGECFGEAEILSYWYDNDGDGLGAGEPQEFCNTFVDSGWILTGGDTDDDCPISDEGIHIYDCNDDCNGDAYEDECGICNSDPSDDSFFNCTGLCDDEDDFGGEYDCSGECGGDTELSDWYPDCDLDGQADNPGSLSICGTPTDLDVLSLCPNGNGNLLSIDPDNHSFDTSPNCTSNIVDECGECEGVGYDCRKVCSPSSPKSLEVNEFNCWETGEGYGFGTQFTIQSPTGQDTTIVISEGCYPFIGYESSFQYSQVNGYDLCGECYLGDLLGGDDYNTNYSCTGCMDDNAVNWDENAILSSYDCSYQLYPGDVNQDGTVNELDIDGIAIFWNYWTEEGRINPNIDWTPQFSYESYWYSPDGLEGDPSCPMFADTNGDAIVESSDITAILNNWGKQVDSQYYYPWGQNGEAPDCLGEDYNDNDQLRENYSEIYNYIVDNCPCDANYEEVINYLAGILDLGTENVVIIPDKFKVYQNTPNPFNPVTDFPINIIVESDVTLRIYNINGSLVHQQSIKSMSPGLYEYSNTPFTWYAENFSSGVYVYSFETSAGDIIHNKLMLIK